MRNSTMLLSRILIGGLSLGDEAKRLARPVVRHFVMQLQCLAFNLNSSKCVPGVTFRGSYRESRGHTLVAREGNTKSYCATPLGEGLPQLVILI